jgi:hypothetical protein
MSDDLVAEARRYGIKGNADVKGDGSMSYEEMIEWIDHASLEQLLQKWRFASVGDEFFRGKIGDHFCKRMNELRQKVGSEEWSAASKKVGWG